MLNNCNAKSAGQNEGDSGICENTDILMRTDDRAPGGEKVVPRLSTFSPRSCTVRTLRNNIETIPACNLGNFPTYVLPAVLLLVQPVESSVQYKTVKLHQKRRVLV